MDELNREQFVQAFNDPFNLFVFGYAEAAKLQLKFRLEETSNVELYSKSKGIAMNYRFKFFFDKIFIRVSYEF